MAVIAEREDEQRDRYRHQWVEHRSARSGLERLLVSFRNNLADPDWARMWVVLTAEATDPDHPAHAAMTARYERLRAEMTEALKQMRETDAIRVHIDPLRAAATVFAVMDGLQIQRLLNPSLDILSAFEDFLINYFAVSLDG